MLMQNLIMYDHQRNKKNQKQKTKKLLNKTAGKAKNASKNIPDVANYDLHPDYHYSSYWRGREYEHKAEFMAISDIFNKIFKVKNFFNDLILDLGAGFGRLVPSYCNHFKTIVLGDYSIKELTDATSYIKKFSCNVKPFPNKDANSYFLGVNAYFLPLKKELFNTVISVRLSHHIEDAQKFLQEVFRVLAPGGIFILEVANKNHIKAVIRNILRLNLKYIKKNKIKIRHEAKSSQGLLSEKQGYVFYNYRVSYIKNLAKAVGFKVLMFKQVSILRHPFLKRVLPVSFMLFIESIYQKLSAILNKLNIFLTPSVFIVLQKPNTTEAQDELKEEPKNHYFNKLYENLICPKHRLVLKYNREKNIFTCPRGCKFESPSKYVYDLRFPIITV